MISDYEEVVIRFKAYRISYPLTQKELSDKSGVSLRSITRFESEIGRASCRERV